ncbi:MAG: prolipoprotein diacylglyceryl transferase [Deltaproteobacteria bacterium]|nr:prolipoprotein diacylglyceryl transferase [Deltaproteobacteria bacterium]
MRPILIRFGDGFFLHSYGVFLAIGFVVGIYLAAREAERLGEDVDAILDLCTWILVASIVGSRVFHVIVFHEQFTAGPHPLLRLWDGRGVFVVSALAVAGVLALLARRAGRERGERPLEPHWPLAALALWGIALMQLAERTAATASTAVELGALGAGVLATGALVAYARASASRLPGAPRTVWRHAEVWVAAIAVAAGSAALHRFGGGEPGGSLVEVFGYAAALAIVLVPIVARRYHQPARRPALRVALAAALAVTLGWVQHVAFHYPAYRRDNLLEILRIWNGGLTYYGGFLGAVLFSLAFCWARGLSFLRVADITSPSIMLGIAFGRLGCAAAGCCHGKVAPDFPLSVVITAKDSLSPRFVPLYPTQVMSSLGDVAIFLLLTWLKPRLGRRGQLFYVMLAVYGTFRFAIEFLRNDPRGFVHLGPVPLAESQVVSIPLVVIGLAALAFSARGTASPAVRAEVS